MAYETILVERRGRVGLITLNRPKALNALNARLIAEIDAALGEFDREPEISAVVLTGSEDDLDEMIGYVAAEANHEEDRRRQKRLDTAFAVINVALTRLDRP